MDIPIAEMNSETGLAGIGSVPSLAPVASFNINAIQNLIDTKGYYLYHYRHAFSPDRQTLQAGVDVNSVEANRYGVMFYEIRKLKAIMVSLPFEQRLQSDSVYGFASAVVNVSGVYADGLKERVYIRPKDLLIPCANISEQTSELLEFNATGVLRAKHKIIEVNFLATKTDRYEPNVDFFIQDGIIVWCNNGRKPKIAEVITVVYYFAPVWVATRVPHTLRIIPSNPQGHGAFPRQLMYAPQQVIVEQNHLQDLNVQVDFSGLPFYSGNADTPNTTGGSL
jgi:hypothetical protein